jgi:hypothetical protein
VELYESVAPPIPIYCDNQDAITLASNNKFHACTKHIDLQYHYVHSLVQSGTLNIQYCPTEDNIADAFTTKAATHKVASRSRVRHSS